MSKEFEVSGVIKIYYTINLEANNKKLAEKKAIKTAIDFYHLDTKKYNSEQEYEIDAFAIENEKQ